MMQIYNKFYQIQSAKRIYQSNFNMFNTSCFLHLHRCRFRAVLDIKSMKICTLGSRLIDENNGGVTLYRVVTKVTDGKAVATFRRYRLIAAWDEMSDRKRREFFREQVNEELFEVLCKYDTLQ